MFDAVTVSEPAPGGANDDFLLVSDNWAIVLDGVSAYPVPDVGCQHGVRWFVNRLGLHFGYRLATAGGVPMTDLLADSIAVTAQDHGPGCDLAHPLTPAATVAAVRVVGGRLDWLVLGDATVAWTLEDGTTNSVTDDRADRLKDAPIIVADVRRYDPAYVASVRNKPGGFWVASAQPEAAHQSLTGYLHLERVDRIGLFSDGVTRLVERFGWTVQGIFEQAAELGVRSLIESVRGAEFSDPEPLRWRGKPHDDATAVVIHLVDPDNGRDFMDE